MLVLSMSVFGWMWFIQQKSPIVEYREEQDREHLMEIFNQDSYLLTNADPSIASQVFGYELKHRSPTLRNRDHGKLSVFVYCDQGKAVAFIAYHYVSPTQVKILYLAVHKDHRRKGYAQALLQNVLDKLEKKGVKSFFLHVRVQNEQALNLYKKLGFKVSRYEDGLAVLERTV